jgi:hypothetical protein
MGESSKPQQGPKPGRNPRDAGSWAVGRNVLRVSDVPAGAVNLNVEGRRVIAGPTSIIYTIIAPDRKASALFHRPSRS